MPYYLFQWKYKDSSVQAMIEEPQDRSAELRKAVEAFHGRMHQFFFSFGEYDGLSIVEFSNNAACASCAAFLIGAGANTSLHTTALLTMKERQPCCGRVPCNPAIGHLSAIAATGKSCRRMKPKFRIFSAPCHDNGVAGWKAAHVLGRDPRIKRGHRTTASMRSSELASANEIAL
jgi:uncharacterized protein with GYD domain